MRRLAFLAALSAILAVPAADLLARGIGGRGEGGGGGGIRGSGINRPSGGGASRPSGGGSGRPSGGGISRPSGGGSRPSSPSLSRPSGGASRPSIGSGNRPSTGSGNRPSIGSGNRPSIGSGNRPSTGSGNRPSIGSGNRPSTGSGNRPSITPGTRPGLTPGGGQRPGLTPGTGQRPGLTPGGGSRPDVGNIQRPSQRPTFPDLGSRPGIGDRPGTGTRPGDRPGIVNRPGTGDRPGIGDRPGTGTRPGDRPGIVNRPGTGDRPGIGNRPGGSLPGLEGRPGIGDRPGIPDRRDQLRDRLAESGRRDNINDRRNDLRDRIDNRLVDQGRDQSRNWHNNRYWHHHHWHHGTWRGNYWRPGRWYRYWWNNYPVLTAFGLTSWAVNRVGYAFGWYRYRNPFVVVGGAPVIVDNRVWNYSQPIVVTSQADTSTPPAEDTDVPLPPGVSPEAMNQFDSARQQFYSGQFAEALASVDAALNEMPGDAILHEFRALALFALGKYQDAAATLYAVLSAGPGWDWTTMIGLYSSVEVYTQHLRALESFRDSHPDDPAPRLILAYHYLTAGHVDEAVTQLRRLLTLLPGDPLVQNLLEELDPTFEPAEPQDLPEPPSADAGVDPATVVGTWQADREGSESFTMELKEDGEFAWSFTQGGQTQTVTGVYVIDEDSVLAMEIEDGSVMLAQLSRSGENLDFMMLGDSRGTPPLQFARMP